jgi:glycosyltransferase involved in cell wall biosynthesis
MEFSPFPGVIPERVHALERFGVGTFSPKEREYKCRQVYGLMKQRTILRGDPLLSVVVPVHKEAHYLLATLRSLAEQTNQNAEFIIVSNGEPYGNLSQRMAEEAGFTVIHERRGGVGRARQAGLLAARGKVIITTDADTLQHPQWLDAIEEEFNDNPAMIAGFGWVHPLTSSQIYYLCIAMQNISRSVLGANLLFCAPEANSWFLRDAALKFGGYDVDARFAEGSMLFKKMAPLGEILPCTREETAVFSSDRRMLTDRIWAVTQYLMSFDSSAVKYEAVR